MVYTNPIEVPKDHEQAEDEMIAAVLSGNVESVPEDNYFRCGYELLPQESDIIEDLEKDIVLDISEEDNSFCSEEKEKSPEEDSNKDDDFPLPESNSQHDVIAWFDSPPVDIEMNSAKVEEVKQVMVNITLPASAIPEWAANVPEDQWKEYLLNKLHIKQSNK